VISVKFEWRPSSKSLAKVLAGAVAVVLVVTGVLTYRACIPGVTFEDGRAFAATLEPASADSLGVAPGSAFTLKLQQPVPLASVRSSFSIEPRVGFDVKAADQEGKTFSITPETPLDPNKVYRFRLALAGPNEPGYSWAFQVAGDLRVVGSLPADRSTGVPLNSGIEIEFTHEGVNDPGNFFSISPFVPGIWQRYRRTLVYVPAVNLQPSTIYTCTVKQGLDLAGSDKTLGQDYVFSFETAGATEGPPSSWFYIDTEVSEFAPTEPPFFSIGYGRYGEEASQLPKVATKVLRYVGVAAFAAALEARAKFPYWAYLSRQNWDPPTAGLEPVLEADIQAQTFEWQNYVVLPKTLPPGYYLVSFGYQGATYYTWIQVTDLSCYTVEATNDTAMWFNSLSSGQPVANVTVRPSKTGAPLGTSGPDGVARFATVESVVALRSDRGVYEPVPPYYVTAKTPSGSELVIDLSPYWNAYSEGQKLYDEYWAYLYTDRPLYLPDDEVSFWGVLEPRERATSEVGKAKVELRSSYGVWGGPFGEGWGEGGSSDATLISVAEVDVIRHTFDGRVKLPNLRPGSYRLELVVGDTTLSTQYFDVATYTKPAYKVSLSADKKAVFAGEPVRFSVDTAFFEGTPVSEMRLAYSLDSAGTSLTGQLTTDITGRAGLSHTPAAGTDPLSLVRRDWLMVNADLPESGPIWRETGVMVFGKNAAIRTSVVADAGGMRVESRLNKVTLDRLNAGDGGGASAGWYWGAEDEYVGDPVTGREVSGQLFEIRWDAREIGQYYDFVAKVTRKTYEYKEVKVPVETFTMTTGADGLASWTFAADQTKTYFVRLDAKDDAGRAIATESYFYGQAFVGSNYGWHSYHVSPTDRDVAKYAVGETATLAVQDREAAVAPRSKGFLFYTARRGLGTVEVKDAPEFSLVFTEDLIPNTNVGAVYFDGRYYNDAYVAQVSFDYSVKKLDVSVKTDKDSYAPGEKAVIDVEVKDLGGAPVAAEVNLCMVDEALYYLSNQSVDLLATLYGRTVWTYIISTRSSHYKRLAGGGGAESGGEGGGARQDFVDTALFESIITGGDGKGRVEVTLPDNLTSWRLTYQALASGVRAGSGSIGVPVRLPFFVELSMNETYLAGDKPVIQARAYGTALPSGTAVTFTAKLGKVKADGTLASKDIPAVNGPAFKPSGIALGTIEKGSYRLTVTGKATLPGGTTVEDTLIKPIDVPETYLRLDRADYYQVGEGLKVTAEPGELAILTFSDLERGKYLQMLWRLVGGGSRADMKAAAAVARRLLTGYYDYEEQYLPPAPSESELLTCQRDDGGVGILPYASSNLELTAKATALDDVGFDRDGLLSYLGNVYDTETGNGERYFVALYGLAALGQPVLADLEKAASEPDLSVKEKLYVAMGLIELGDEETARGIFAGVLEAEGDRVGPLLRLNVSRDQEEIIAATSLAAVIATQLRADEAGALREYLLDNVPWEDLNLMEMAVLLQAAVPVAPTEPVAFTLQPDGTTVSLKPGEVYTCLRTAEELASLGFSGVQGKVGLCVSYRAPVDLGSAGRHGGQANLKRTYWVAGKETSTFDAGDVVKVVINYSVTAHAPEGPYQIVDFLPAGLKAVPWPRHLGINDPDTSYPVEVDGQKITFYASFEPGPVDPKTGKPAPRGGSGKAVYYARIVSLGSFKADQAGLIHIKSGEIFALAEKDNVDIK